MHTWKMALAAFSSARVYRSLSLCARTVRRSSAKETQRVGGVEVQSGSPTPRKSNVTRSTRKSAGARRSQLSEWLGTGSDITGSCNVDNVNRSYMGVASASCRIVQYSHASSAIWSFAIKFHTAAQSRLAIATFASAEVVKAEVTRDRNAMRQRRCACRR